MSGNRSHEIVGHERIRDSLKQRAIEGNLHSAVLFGGPESIGKRLCAIELASTLLCDSPSKSGPCRECASCKIIEAGNHPDLVLVRSAQWGVEEVRDLLYSLNLAPYLGKNRVVIFDEPEMLRVQAANTLLKSLEEPRPGTFFILVSSQPSKLLNTIRSRCQLWQFSSLNSGQVKGIISKGLDAKAVDNSLIDCADGSLRFLELLKAEPQLVSAINDKLEVLDGIGLMGVFDGLTKDKERLLSALQIVLYVARKKLRESTDSSIKKIFGELIESTIRVLWLVGERNVSPVLGVRELLRPILQPSTFTKSAMHASIQGGY